MVADARRKVELLSRLERVRLDAPDLLAAIDLQGLHGLSFRDALIIRTTCLPAAPSSTAQTSSPASAWGRSRS
jgi:hypothetical protein